MMRFLIFITCISCSFAQRGNGVDNTAIVKVSNIPLPNDYSRIAGKDTLFSKYLSNIGFKAINKVLLYDGSEKTNQTAHYKVLDMGVGKKNLQQCADAVIRLRAEYLFKVKRFKDIQFHFTSGDNCTWLLYAEGYRPTINGNKVSFNKSAQKDTSYKNFNRYLDLIYSYCGTASLFKELKSKSIKDIAPGDVFIQTHQPYGHAVMVMEVAKNTKGNTLFTLAQSYMPAQEIHILKNPSSQKLSPWYEAKEGDIATPEWNFVSGDLKTW